MEVYCVRDNEKFNVDTTILNKVIELRKSLGLTEEPTPEEWLEILPPFLGKCKRKGFEDKRHAISYTEDDSKLRKDITSLIDKSTKERDDIGDTIRKLRTEKEQISIRLNEIENLIPGSETRYNESNEVVNTNISNFEKLTGTRNIDIWRK